MLRLRSRAIRLTVIVTAVGLGSQARGEFGSSAYAASQISAGTTRPVIGKLQSATKHALILVRSGTNKLTPILLNAKTTYIVKGKRVAKPPIFARGSLISVVTAVSKGAYTAQVVVISPATSAAQGTSTGSPAGGSTVSPSPSTSVSGTVTLTSAASVTLKTSMGTETIKLTAATRYLVQGKPSQFKPVLHAGEKVEITAVQTRGVLVGQVFAVV
jgi:hypothetical protein